MPCPLSQRFKLVNLSRYISLAGVFPYVLFMVVLISVNALPALEIANDNNEMPKRASYADKRNWQSLQGAWGKRSLDADLSAELTEADDDVYFAERRVPLAPDSKDHPAPILRYSLVYLKNAGGVLDRLANGDYDVAPDSKKDNNLLQYDAETEHNEPLSTNDGLVNDKRAWKSMNVAWGKRRSAPQWNKFRGAWGKREPGWNNLKGMWGKRSAKDWQKLHGSWGKRSMPSSMDSN